MENFALVQRPAPFSWEAMTTLVATDQATAPVTVRFPRPVIIVAAYPSISWAAGVVGLAMPTLDDLLVTIELDVGVERRLTSRYDTVATNGVSVLPNVTLGSFRDSSGGARVMNYEIGGPDSRPELQVTYTWKRAITGGPWYRDIFVGLTFQCQFK